MNLFEGGQSREVLYWSSLDNCEILYNANSIQCSYTMWPMFLCYVVALCNGMAIHCIPVTVTRAACSGFCGTMQNFVATLSTFGIGV